MKKFYLSILLLSAILNAQSWQWGKRGGSNDNVNNGPEKINKILTDGQGNVYAISPVGVSGLDVDGHEKEAYSTPGSTVGQDQMIVSFSCDGTYRWSKVFGGWGNDTSSGMTLDGEGIVYVSANYGLTYTGHPANQIDEDYIFPQSESNELTDKQTIYLFNYDSNGYLQWVVTPQPTDVTIGGIGSGYTFGLETDAAGNSWWWISLNPGVYANGAYTVTTAGYQILKYDAGGNFIGGFPIDMQFGGGIGAKMRRNPVSGTIYFIGSAEPFVGTTATFGGQSVTNQLYLAAFDAQGNFLWKKESSTNSISASILDCTLDEDGSIYVTGTGRQNMAFDGHIFTTAAGNSFPYIMKLNANGDLIWATNCTSVTATCGGYGITKGAITGNYGNMTWDGHSISGSGQGYDVFFARFDPDNGQIIGLDGLPGDTGYVDYGTAVANDPYGNFYVGGYFGHFLSANGPTPMVNEGPESDFFIAKFGTANCSLGTADNVKPEIKAWPNPVAKILNLENLDVDCTYELYDANGKRVGEGKLAENRKIDMERYAPGLYLLRLQTATDEMTVKVIKE